MFFRKWIFDLKKNRLQYARSEINKIVIKSLLYNPNFNTPARVYFYGFLKNYSIFSSRSFFKRACVVSGYSKAIFRLFKMSRQHSKRFASAGVLVGMRRSSF